MSTATLRRLPVPVSEPYASTALLRDRSTGSRAAQTQLLLTFAATTRTDGEDRWLAPQPTPSGHLPDPGTTARALVQAVVEVLAGTRPAAQLVRWLSADVYAALQRRAALAARLARPAAASGPARRPVVRAVRTSAPADGVVEASAVVLDRGRIRAVAVRLEGLDGRWRATALEVG
ncbi:MAG: Rv3235 family protein [Actinomycetes bacterium]